MKKQVLISVMALLLAMVFISNVGCGSNNPSETKYWFSKTSTNFVAYDDEQNNISEAGTYWYFTAAKNMEIEMKLITSAKGPFAAVYLYVNNEQVKSETNTEIYDYVYKLTLKKGDEIKIHAFWVNSLMVDEKGFEIQQICIKQDGKTYILSEFDKLK